MKFLVEQHYLKANYGKNMRVKIQMEVFCKNQLSGPRARKLMVREPQISRLASVSPGQSASSLLSGLSARIIPRRVADIVKRYHTLPVPNHVPFSDSESTESEEIQQQGLIAPDEVLPDEVSRVDLVEERRGLTSHEASADPSASGMLKSLSMDASEFSSMRPPRHITSLSSKDGFISTLPDLQKDLLLETEPLEPVLEPLEPISDPLEPIPGPEPESIFEPITEPMDETVDLRRKRRSKPICDYSPVSPERMSPPSSYRSITSRLMETLALIQEAVSESPIPNYTTFTDVIEKTVPTKKRVALLFNDLLHLHAQKFIVVEQETMEGEVSIQLLTDESGASGSQASRLY